MGRSDDVMGIRERFADIGEPDDESAEGILSDLMEAATLIADDATVQIIEPRLTPFSSVIAFSQFRSMHRLLGDATELLNRPDEALVDFRKALETCTTMQHLPELAITHLGLAELLLYSYPDQHAEGIVHLDYAIAKFNDMGMTPSLEHALGRKQMLGA
jgi:hypothetical protein